MMIERRCIVVSASLTCIDTILTEPKIATVGEFGTQKEIPIFVTHENSTF